MFGKKIMYSIFFDGMANVTQIIVPRGKKVTGNFYGLNIYPRWKKRTRACGLHVLVRECDCSMIMPGLTKLVKSKRK